MSNINDIFEEFDKIIQRRRNERMKTDYFMGLDMGTGSLGWAVTDSSYHLCRAHGKDLWGVRVI